MEREHWRCGSVQVPRTLSTQVLFVPTNTQFVERSVKESGFVAPGCMYEKNRTILSITHSKTITESLSIGRTMVNLNHKGNNNKKT